MDQLAAAVRCGGASLMSSDEAPEVGAACVRLMRALARRAGEGELEALEYLAALQTDAQLQLGAAVAGYRAGPAGASWAAVGEALGMTRQSAQERFSHATPDLAHGPRCACDSRLCPNYVELPDLVAVPCLPGCKPGCTVVHYA